MSDFLKLGLLGHPLSHALSATLQSAALQFAGIKGEYSDFDIKPEFLTDGIQDMLASGVKGFNITIPYKQSIYKMADDLTEEARLATAVNTVKVENSGKLFGHNTDIIGFKLALSEAFADPFVPEKNVHNSGGTVSSEKTALIIGAGGAARAVVVALAQLGFKKVKIMGRDSNKVRSFISEMETNLAQTIGSKDSMLTMSLWENEPTNFADLDLVINASPIGLKDEAPPEWISQLIAKLNDQCLCFDLVYGRDGKLPVFTKLALRRGLNAIDGLPMLIHQARYAFEFWTGVMVPSQVMYDSLQAIEKFEMKDLNI